MNLAQRILVCSRARDGQLIANFGTAELVRCLSGRYEVRGVTPADLKAARLWCSIFFRNVTIAWPTCATDSPDKKG